VDAFTRATERYAEMGVDVESAIRIALAKPISIHCWQADDVGGLEAKSEGANGGGIMATGNFPGKARNGDEIRMDLDEVLRWIPGSHRLNLHASYAETGGQAIDRDALEPQHFQNWMDWGRERGVALDFNPTYFAHPHADSGFTLSSRDESIRAFWIEHGRRSREIAAWMAAQQGDECVNNHWIPDGAKDSPADRWSPRARLKASLDAILEGDLPGCVDAVESKLFGLGSEDYVVGSFEFYSQYALQKSCLFCLDMGHFHPTESVADKLSALLQFQERILIHTSRPKRWDSDHIVIFDDDVRGVFQEVVRGGALDRVLVALDFFDASVNRIAAYVMGIRSTRKALLYALLEPNPWYTDAENEGRGARKLALMEETKTLPFGDVWDELCRRGGVEPGLIWIDAVEAYERNVLRFRG